MTDAQDALAQLLAPAAGPTRPPVSLSTVRVIATSPLRLDDGGGSSLDGAVKVIGSYNPAVGDLALMIRQGGLAAVLGKV